MRNEFAKRTKRILAERVGFLCSFPGCQEITIGPGQDADDHVLNLGEAAHIYAAAAGGPRYNPLLTDEECSGVANGIWMCRKHARMIDLDYMSYSANTLQQWKKDAESRAHNALHGRKTEFEDLTRVLIRLSNRFVFWANWLSVENVRWTFRVLEFVEGNAETLQLFCIDFDQSFSLERFIIIESQGDGRQLSQMIWRMENTGKIIVECGTVSKAPRIDHRSWSDIGLGEDGDLDLSSGDFRIITGTDVAIQTITAVLSSQYGDYSSDPFLGSHFNFLLKEYQHHPLLYKIIKMEVVRLLTVGIPYYGSDELAPPLDFVNRVLDVQILGVRQLPLCSPVIVFLSLEFGNGEFWSGMINIPVR